jgi:hypothetical protein
MWWISRFINYFDKEELWISSRFYQLSTPISKHPAPMQTKGKKIGAVDTLWSSPMNQTRKRYGNLAPSINLTVDIHELIRTKRNHG